MKFLIVIFMVLVLGALFIISNQGIDFSHSGDLEIFYDSFYYWVGDLFDNVKLITGNVVNMDWLP